MGERGPLIGQIVIGLLFAGVAAVAVWSGLGRHISGSTLNHAMPVFLIVVGLTGLLLGRRR